MITKFCCEECGESFNTYSEALDHEKICFSLRKKQEVEIIKVCDYFEENYADQIFDVGFEVDEQTVSTSSKDCISSFVTFKLEITTIEGQQIIIRDRDIESGNLIMAEDIINIFKSKIESLLPQEYEGVVINNSGYGHLIGEVHLNDICSRLEGKKVRIQVID